MSERGGAQPDLGTNAEAPAAADPRRSPDPDRAPPITYPDGVTVEFERRGGQWCGFRGGICVIARPTLREAVEVEGAKHGAEARPRRRR